MVLFKDEFRLVEYFVLWWKYTPDLPFFSSLVSPVGLHFIESVFDQTFPDMLVCTDIHLPWVNQYEYVIGSETDVRCGSGEAEYQTEWDG